MQNPLDRLETAIGCFLTCTKWFNCSIKCYGFWGIYGNPRSFHGIKVVFKTHHCVPGHPTSHCRFEDVNFHKEMRPQWQYMVRSCVVIRTAARSYRIKDQLLLDQVVYCHLELNWSNTGQWQRQPGRDLMQKQHRHQREKNWGEPVHRAV